MASPRKRRLAKLAKREDQESSQAPGDSGIIEEAVSATQEVVAEAVEKTESVVSRVAETAARMIAAVTGDDSTGKGATKGGADERKKKIAARKAKRKKKAEK